MADRVCCCCSNGSGECGFRSAVRVTAWLPSGQRRLELLAQSHCAFCWRPLLVARGWPGPRVSQLPPMNQADRELRASSCGHVYHASCSGAPHCATCGAFVSTWRAVHWKTVPQEDAIDSGSAGEAPRKPRSNTAAVTALEGEIDRLKRRLHELNQQVLELIRNM